MVIYYTLKKTLFSLIFPFVIFCTLFSCRSSDNQYPENVEKTLKSAGSNRQELEKVLTHYSIKNDSLKYKAACFLIENMIDKYSIVRNDIAKEYKNSIFLLGKEDEKSKKAYKDECSVLWTPQYFMQHHSSHEIIRDVDVIPAHFLIKNIDLAFEAWNKFKHARNYSFEDFCEYVLPYRYANEPLSNWRAIGFERHASLLDSIDDPVEIAKHLIFQLKLTYIGMIEYPYPMPFEAIEAIGGGDCIHLTVHLNFLLRSIGIPAAIDRVPAWANRSQTHQWNIVIDTCGDTVDLGINAEAVNGINYKTSKLYRNTFSICNKNLSNIKSNHLDVTKIYAPDASTIDIPIDMPDGTVVCLSTFNNSNWVPVMHASVQKGKVQFKNVARGRTNRIGLKEHTNAGCGIVLLIQQDKDGLYKAVTTPFILHETGEIKYLNPDSTETRSVFLSRKYPQFIRFKRFKKWLQYGCFEGANKNDFSDKKELCTIQEEPQFIISRVRTTSSSTFRYVRFTPSINMTDTISIGELTFFEDGKKLTGTCIADSNKLPEGIEHAFDGNVETFFESPVSQCSYIGLDFGEPRRITEIEYVPRTDNNGITVGDIYELFYWKDKWISRGIQKATAQTIGFHNVPENALLFLHNHSRGREERIFTYENETHIWW